ncbi:hypothetical protein HELRODRAFT_171205 [Helobdella robusta]|uniref:Uncharacterized protein n=1 Tax=Helobdella robusta TaxID=6412 RepID=T1F3X8_HELRO|nr:hypothetical protein HELRODRAFT_171205 [Helobdella robusta]ESO05564.1 hypothetical protein HELRODRAFT_171205 [Helobdella robusta]
MTDFSSNYTKSLGMLSNRWTAKDGSPEDDNLNSRNINNGLQVTTVPQFKFKKINSVQNNDLDSLASRQRYTNWFFNSNMEDDSSTFSSISGQFSINSLKREHLTLTQSVGNLLHGLNNLCKNAEDQIIFTENTKHKLTIFDFCGERISSGYLLDNGLRFPGHMYQCQQTRRLVMVERPPIRKIKIITADFSKVTSFSYHTNNPHDVCVDRNLNIILLDSMLKTIYIYDEMGVLLKTVYCRDVLLPFNIDVNQHEELFICDNKKHCIEVFNYEGRNLRTIGKRFIINFPIFVRIGRNDEVIVADNHMGFNVTIFNRGGDTILAVMQSTERIKKCYSEAVTSKGMIVLTTGDCNLLIYKFPPTVLKKLNWDSIPDMKINCKIDGNSKKAHKRKHFTSVERNEDMRVSTQSNNLEDGGANAPKRSRNLKDVNNCSSKLIENSRNLDNDVCTNWSIGVSSESEKLLELNIENVSRSLAKLIESSSYEDSRKKSDILFKCEISFNHFTMANKKNGNTNKEINARPIRDIWSHENPEQNDHLERGFKTWTRALF